MRQRATIESVSGTVAVVSVRRESACSGDCHSCAGCGAVAQTLQVCGDNLIGAKPGDRVYIDSSTAVVLWAAVLVYMAPLLGFFAGYFMGLGLWSTGIWGAPGFVLGWIPALIYNRRLKKRPPTYTIVGFVEHGTCLDM